MITENHIMRLKMRILRAEIVPIKVDEAVCNELIELYALGNIDKAYKVVDDYLMEHTRCERVVWFKDAQVIYEIINKKQLKIGFDIKTSADLNRIKISNPNLAQRIKENYDVRV